MVRLDSETGDETCKVQQRVYLLLPPISAKGTDPPRCRVTINPWFNGSLYPVGSGGLASRSAAVPDRLILASTRQFTSR